jgi:hypothetical protein
MLTVFLVGGGGGDSHSPAEMIQKCGVEKKHAIFDSAWASSILAVCKLGFNVRIVYKKIYFLTIVHITPMYSITGLAKDCTHSQVRKNGCIFL